MKPGKSTAAACSNVPFIKYWGNRDAARRVPLNDSISMNLDHATTTTTVAFDEQLNEDEVMIGDKAATELAKARVVEHLNRIRALAKMETKARVESHNTFPMGVGIASSASGFAALTLAGTHAAGLDLSEKELSMLARRASGSASRSVPGGFVEWVTGSDIDQSYATSIAQPDYWDLRDAIAIVTTVEKAISSTEGHKAAPTSLFLPERLNALPVRFHRVRRAVLSKDLALLGPAIEDEAIEMHMIAMTSRPRILYWAPGTVRVIQEVLRWRNDGLAVYFTLDAGPNVHLICEGKDAEQVTELARQLPEVQSIISNRPGGPAQTVE